MTIARKEVIQVRVSEAEKSDIRQRAAALGLDMSEYGRLRMLRDGPPPDMAAVPPLYPQPRPGETTVVVDQKPSRIQRKPPPKKTAVIASGKFADAPLAQHDRERGHLRPAPMGSLLKEKGPKK